MNQSIRKIIPLLTSFIFLCAFDCEPSGNVGSMSGRDGGVTAINDIGSNTDLDASDANDGGRRPVDGTTSTTRFDCTEQDALPVSECVAVVTLAGDVVPDPFRGQHPAQQGVDWYTTKNPCDWRGVGCGTVSGGNHVVDIILNGAGLVGDVQVDFSDLPELGMLNLSGNSLTGPLPTSIGSLSKLRVLNLWKNELTGSIPGSYGALGSLERISLSGNKISGSIPAVLGRLSKLMTLGLQDNMLTGTIPRELAGSARLMTINVSNNELSGKIPDEIGELPVLVGFYAANNSLTGALPPSLFSQTRLCDIDVSGNELSGVIPKEFGLLGTKTSAFCITASFDISRNKFSGSLPNDITHIPLYDSAADFRSRIGICPQRGGLTADPSVAAWLAAQEGKFDDSGLYLGWDTNSNAC